MATAQINTDMLTWARERSGTAVPAFAEKMHQPESRINEWERGEHSLTFKQAMDFAKQAHVPFGYLFLNEPPQDELPIPDLRTVNGQGCPQPSGDLIDLIKLMDARLQWYRDYAQQQYLQPFELASQFSVNTPIQQIVQNMRSVLGVGLFPSRGDSDDYYRYLVNRIESVGVLVMRQGDMGHWTRPLLVEEFRGFAMVDEYAPLIFVNHADAPGPRLFTLIHELCHIWIGQSGVSTGDTQTHIREEVLCNAVAAEFLVPEEEFIANWPENAANWKDALPALEAHFRVSTWVLARRAHTLGLISLQDYREYIAERRAAYEARARAEGGPTYYRAKQAQLSRRFSVAVTSEALSGGLSLRDAGHYLGMQPGNIKKYAGELGI